MSISAKSYVALGGSYMKSGAVYNTATISSFLLEGKEDVVSFDASFRWIPFNRIGVYANVDAGVVCDKDIVSVDSALPVFRTNQRLGFSLSCEFGERIGFALDVFALQMINLCKGSYFNKPQWSISTFNCSWGLGVGMALSYFFEEHSGVFVSFDLEKTLGGLGFSAVEKNSKEKLEHSNVEVYGSMTRCCLGYMWRM